MADDSLSTTYATNRRTADKEELDTWAADQLSRPEVVQQTPTEPTKPEKKEKAGIVSSAVSAVKDTFIEGASNFIQGINRRHESMGDLKPEGQQILGVLQVLSALPAGVGAAVQAALGKYAPGLESAEAIPGGKAGEMTPAGMIRATLSAPSLALDPKMREAIAKNPTPMAEALNEPMTYGELANIISQFATPWAMKKAGGLVKGRGTEPTPEAPVYKPVEGEIVTEGAPALGSAPQPRGALMGREPLALPERGTPEPLVTPPPAESSSFETRIRAAQQAGPEEYARVVAEELQAALEQAPARTLQDAIVERYTRPSQPEPSVVQGEAPKAGPGELVDAQGKPVAGEPGTMPERERLRSLERTKLSEPSRAAAPETATLPPLMPGSLSSALEHSMVRSEQIIGEELGLMRERISANRLAEAKAAAESRRSLEAANMAEARARHAGPVPTVEEAAGNRAHTTLDISTLESTGRKTEAAPSEIIQRVEREMPDATPDAKEARINELMGVGGKPAARGLEAIAQAAGHENAKAAGLARVVDTENAARDAFGNAGAIDEATGTVHAVHVTDDPASITQRLREGGSLVESYAGGADRAAGAELGGGLYASATPQLWTGRSGAKWGFLEHLDRGQRSELGKAILDKLAARGQGYVTSSEIDTAIRLINEYEKSGFAEPVTMLAEQPYNVKFWEPEFLAKLGIEQTAEPKQIPLEARGRFVQLERVPDSATVRELQAEGFDGAFLKGGMVELPQMVVWNPEAVVRFGDFTRATGKGHPLADLTPAEIDSVMGTLDLMWNELRDAAPGQRHLITDELGKVSGGLAEPSTYPDFMSEVIGKKTRANANKLMDAIDDIHAGKVTGDVHQRLIDYAKAHWEEWAGRFDFSGEAGGVDPGMLARMGLGAALGGTQGDTPEERIRNAFLGLGLGAMVSKRLAQRLAEAYRESGLSDETGAINVGAFRKKPAVGAAEKDYQPNYQRLDSTPAVLATMKNVHRAMKDDILARRGPARSNDLRVQEALELINSDKMTPERVLTLGDKEMLTDSEMTAARILSARAFEYSTDIKQKVLKGEAVPEGTLRESLAVAGAMGRNTRVAQTRIAQAQQASSIKVSGESVAYRPEDVASLADEMLPGMTDKQIATMMGKATAEQVGRAATFWSLFPRMALEGMYFSYLSGKAAFRNAVGNVSMMALAPVDRGIARFMPRWGSEKPGVLPGEATQMARALGESLIDHVRMFRHLDQIDEAAGKLGLGSSIRKSDRRQPALTADNLRDLGITNDTLLTLGQWMGDTFRFPGAVLDKTDVASRSINGNMAHRVEAFRQATFEGLTNDTSPTFEARVNDLMNDVTQLKQASRERIKDFSEEQTFTKEFEGRIMRALSSGPENEWLNLLYRGAVMPFFRVVARMTEQTAARSPGLNFASKQFWEDWNAGGARRQVAQARVVGGAAIIGGFMYLESQGVLTGNAPKDKKLRAIWEAAGYQQRSFWDPVNEKWRSYDGLGPLTSMVAGAVDTSATIRRLPEASGMHVFWAYLMSQIDSLDSRTFTQSVSNLMDMIKNPSNDSRAEQGMAFLRRQIAGWLKPGVVREIESMADPEVRRVIRNGARENGLEMEWQALMDDVRAGWPGFSSEKDEHGNFLVPPSRNPVTGEVTIVDSFPFNPFPGRKPKDIPVKLADGRSTGLFEELIRLRGAGIDELPDWIGGGSPGANVGMAPDSLRDGIRLTPQEKDRWVQLMTQVVKPLGVTYAEALKQTMESPAYLRASDGQTGSDGGKADMLKAVERAYRVTAEQVLRKESPTLDKAITKRQGERAINKANTEDQPGLRRMLEGMLLR